MRLLGGNNQRQEPLLQEHVGSIQEFLLSILYRDVWWLWSAKSKGAMFFQRWGANHQDGCEFRTIVRLSVVLSSQLFNIVEIYGHVLYFEHGLKEMSCSDRC